MTPGWQRDSPADTMSSATVIKAYTLSCLLLSLLLLWCVGDAWRHYAHFCVTATVGEGLAEFLMLASPEWRLHG